MSRTGPLVARRRQAGQEAMMGDSTVHHPNYRRGQRLAAVGLSLVVALGGLASCTNGEFDPSGLPSIDLPTITVSLPELPGPESEQPEPAAVTQPPAQEQASPEDSGVPPWLWWVIGGVAVVGLVGGIGGVIRRWRVTRTLREDLISRGAWVVDHGTGALLSAHDPSAAQLAWTQLDGALVDLTADVRRLSARARGEQATHLREVRDAVAGLRMSAETDAKARLVGVTTPTATTAALLTARRRVADALAVLDPEAASE